MERKNKTGFEITESVRAIKRISTEPVDLCITQLPCQSWDRKKECMQLSIICEMTTTKIQSVLSRIIQGQRIFKLSRWHATISLPGIVYLFGKEPTSFRETKLKQRADHHQGSAEPTDQIKMYYFIEASFVIRFYSQSIFCA